MRPGLVYLETAQAAPVLRWVGGWRRAAVAALFLLAACGGGDSPDNAALASAMAAHQPAEVTVQGRVVDVGPDIQGGRDGTHERFDLDVNGAVVEVDHNLGLAPRVPVRPGDVVTIHGQFEPDPGHPVIHYTHHATGRHEGGWIDFGGQRYQ